MPFINVNLDEAVEAKPVPHGKYDVTISACEEVLTKTASLPQFKITLNIDGHDEAPPVWHYVGIPSEGDEPEKANFKALLLKRFLHLFGIPYDKSGIDTEKLAMEMPGATAHAELQLSEYNGNVSNVLVVPRLNTEGIQAKGAIRPPKRAA